MTDHLFGSASRRNRARALELGRLAYGAVQLGAPRRLAGLVGADPSPRAVTVIRVLGARHVLQALALLLVDRTWAHRLGAVVDGLHATSLPFLAAVADGDDARLARVDTVVATSLALVESRTT